jgi:hypothetical protein
VHWAPTTKVANAVAGVVDALTVSKSGYDSSMRWVSGHDDDDEAFRELQGEHADAVRLLG